MFCENCGSRIADGASFCENCGKPIGSNVGMMADTSVRNGRKAKRSFWDSFLSIFHGRKTGPQRPYEMDPPEYIPPRDEVIPPGSRPGNKNEVFTPPELHDDKTVGYISPKPLEMEDDDDVTTDVSSLDDTFRIEPEPAGLIILEAKENPADTYRIPLTTVMTLGRSAENSDIILKGDKSVSRRYCRLFKEDKVCYVEDLNSHNHTFVNDVMIEEPVALHVGDVLRVGKQELIVKECDMEYVETDIKNSWHETGGSDFNAVFCPVCGKKFTNGEAFCDECGSRLPHLDIGYQGAPPVVSRYCPQCGKKFYEDEQFCDECGARIN